MESRRADNGSSNIVIGRARLPVAGAPRPERADAARNRRAILDATERLMVERGGDHFAMDDVAAAAGVGVGTLYRRFGDRAGLAYALLDDRERGFQAAFLFGPAPLGPGAPPVARIRAFLHAYVDYLEAYTGLMVVAETSSPGARSRSGAHQVHLAHVAALIRQAQPDADAAYLAEALLAPLQADLFAHQRRERGMTIERIKAGLDALLRCLDDAWRR